MKYYLENANLKTTVVADNMWEAMLFFISNIHLPSDKEYFAFLTAISEKGYGSNVEDKILAKDVFVYPTTLLLEEVGREEEASLLRSLIKMPQNPMQDIIVELEEYFDGKQTPISSGVLAYIHEKAKGKDILKNFVEFLENNGYNVTEDDYLVYRVDGQNILGGFAWAGAECSGYMDGYFIADNDACFDKWSKCPFGMELMKVLENPQELLNHLEFLGSEDGFKWSDEYGYLDNPLLPQEHLCEND